MTHIHIFQTVLLWYGYAHVHKWKHDFSPGSGQNKWYTYICMIGKTSYLQVCLDMIQICTNTYGNVVLLSYRFKCIHNVVYTWCAIHVVWCILVWCGWLFCLAYIHGVYVVWGNMSDKTLKHSGIVVDHTGVSESMHYWRVKQSIIED